MKKKDKLYNKKLFFFEEVNGVMTPVSNYNACELTIPGSNIQVFYVKEIDLYLPRGTRRMGKDAYWYCIRNNREIVNFTMKNLNEEMKKANLDYDHTDMRYALQNLKELIKRNYRDKATTWWKEYKDVIATVIFIFAITCALAFVFWRTGILLDKIGSLLAKAEEVLEVAKAAKGSGVIVK